MSTTTATKAIHGLSPANEVFCQCLARGYTKTAAYREAYPKSKTWTPASAANKASALSKVAAIQARVAEIHAPAIRQIQENAAGYGLKQAMDECEEALQLARSLDQPATMIQATLLKSKLNALLVERKEVTVTEMGSMTPSEKLALMEAARGQLQLLKLPEQAIDDVEAKGG